MSPIPNVTLNTIELTRINFLPQNHHESVPKDSEKFQNFPIICGKNAEIEKGLRSSANIFV